MPTIENIPKDCSQFVDGSFRLLMVLSCLSFSRMGQLLYLLAIMFLAHMQIYSQAYFKNLGPAAPSYNLKVDHFSNGDFLIADSRAEGRNNHIGSLVLTKLDNCGTPLWQRAFEREAEYLEFRDMVISPDDEVYLFGSAFRGFAELIFLMKVDAQGDLIRFNLFETETVDRFTYSIDWQNGELMIYGLLLDFSTKKEGFMAIFDTGLNFRWGKKFTPFESTGRAIITNDRSYVGWSGPYFYKLDQNGDLAWAQSVRTDLGVPFSVDGPIESDDGYIFLAQKDDLAYFFRLSTEGALTWTSDQFACTNTITNMQKLTDGRLMLLYSIPDTEKSSLGLITLLPDGSIEGQKTLVIDRTFDPESLFASVTENGIVTVISNSKVRQSFPVDVEDFLFQFPLDQDEHECYAWMPINDTQANQQEVLLMPIDTPVLDTRMELLDIDRTFQYDETVPEIADYCEAFREEALYMVDSTFVCGEVWEVKLPNSSFQWQDDPGLGAVRILTSPGIYRASNRNCIDLVVYEYHMQRPECACAIYLPNAFTPNGDGINDLITLQGNCTLQKLDLKIFDRWGNLLFQSNQPQAAWNGKLGGEVLPEGTYVVQATYQWLNEQGNPEEGTVAGDVLLLH